MKKILLFGFILCGLNAFAQTTIAYQGFEQNSADTWSLSLTTPACSSGGDVWDYVNSLSSINPSVGSQFWGISDLNGNCGSSTGESLTFASTSVSGFSNVKIDFDYNISGFDNGDDIFYTLTVDGVSNAQVQLVDGSSNFSTAGFVTETVLIPDGSSTVEFEIFVTQNGGDFAGLDNFILSGLPSGGNLSPTITNIVQTPNQTVLSSDTVDITAVITDTDGVASAEIQYGFASGVLTETPIAMTNVGNDYSATIPTQADGTTVYYQIVATDSNMTPASGSSSELSYTVMDPIPAPSLIISEVSDPGDDFDGRFVEIYNNGSNAIDFSVTTVFIAVQVNGNNISSTALTGVINPGDYYVIGNSSNLQTVYGISADLDYGTINGNGDDGYYLYVGGDQNSGTLFDSFGELGIDGSGQAWDYENSRAIRNSLMDTPSSVWQASSWTITSADVADMTPGAGEPVDYIYDGTSWTPLAPEGVSSVNDNITVSMGSIAFTGTVDVKNLTVASSATLDLGANTVNLAGDADLQGNVSADQSSINLSGNAAQIFSVDNSFTVENLTIDNASGVDLLGDISIEGVVTLTDGVLTTNGSNVVFKSSNGTSAVVAPVVNGSVVGDVTVEQFYPARRAFRFVSSPVDMTGTIFSNWQQSGLNPGDSGYEAGIGTQITGGAANGFDASTTNNPSLFDFSNDGGQSWNAAASTDMTSLNAGDAYRLFIRGDRSIDLASNSSVPVDTKLITTGALKTGDATQSFSSTLTSGDFVFTGNPYQSKVDISLLMNDASAIEDINPNFMYVWNPQAGTRGAYRAYDFSTSTSAPSDTEVNGVLQPGQSMFLLVDNDGDSDDPSVTYKETFKSTGSNLTTTFSTPEAIVSMNLSNGNTNLDGFRVNFSTNGNDAINQFDLNKLNNLDENIALVNGTTDLAIESRSLPVNGTILPLKINRFSTGSYDFQFNVLGLTGLDAYLLDTHSGQYHLLQNNNQTNISLSFDVSSTTSIAADRFLIQFSNTTLTNNDFNLKNQVSVYPNPVNNGLFNIIGLSDVTPVSVKLYNLSGQLLSSKEYEVINGQVVVSDLESLNMGVYLLSLQQEGQQTVKQLIIE